MEYSLCGEPPGTLDLTWHSYSDPAHFFLKHRISGADVWNQIQLPGSARTYNLGPLQDDTWYELQLFSVYDPGPNELVLPSEILLASLNLTPADDPGLAPAAVWMGCQPNPFAGSGLIRVGTKDAGPAKVTVYNLKGQKVREFHSGILPAGATEFTWDGLDERGISCSQGVYLVRFKAQGCPSVVRRITLLKS